MKIGIVTVLYNSEKHLAKFLSCIENQSYGNFKAYCVDNASTDLSRDIARSYLGDPRIELIENMTNIGVAAANNQGISAALSDGCEYVVFCNNDMTFAETTVDRIAAKTKEHPGAMLAPKILFGDGKSIYYAGGHFSCLRGVPRHRRYSKKDDRGHAVDRLVGYAGTAFLAVPTHICRKIKMDERYFVYLDDPDFVIRAIRSGFKLVYVPSITILHFASSSTGGKYSDFTLRYVSRNTIFFLRKNYKFLGAVYARLYVLRTILIWLRVNSAKKQIISEALIEGFAMGTK